MRGPRLVLCGGAEAGGAATAKRTELRLDTRGDDANVNLKLEDVARVLVQDLTPRLVDLLEIASYIFAADCSTERDGKWTDDGATEPWSRSFHFVIAVRDPQFWSRADVSEALTRVVRFLSDDQVAFEFTQADAPAQTQSYLELKTDQWPEPNVDRVVMFSGGLDSLAGAVECARRGERLVLVSHRPTPQMSKRQRELVAALRRTFPETSLLHIPVWVNKDKVLGREHTQRTRSLLFASLGTVVAESLRAPAVTFFENGIVSINLPIADEVLGARASRTTHPQALRYLSRLMGLVVGRPLEVENPFIFDTKTEVVERLRGEAAPLIALTCSCAHTGIFQSKTQWHCGACSQCIDRRIALLNAGLGASDAPEDYRTDVFRGPRSEGYERNIAVGYARHAVEIHRMGEVQVATKFAAELARAAKCHPPARESAERFATMHKRHAEGVFAVLQEQVQVASAETLSGTLDPSSLLALVQGGKHLEPTWSRYASRLGDVLAAGLHSACQTEQPKNEPRLQELCDGLLRSANENLVREYPLLAWGSAKTKPDWSRPGTALWVELKYVRTRKDVGEVSRAIAQDLTLYGDNQRKVLFVVYDPKHLIPDDAEFGRQIESRPGMFLRIIRA